MGMEERINERIDKLQQKVSGVPSVDYRQTVTERQLEVSESVHIFLNRPEDIKNIDFKQMLGGVPASFVRIKTTQDGEVQYKKWSDQTWKEYHEDIFANRPQRWRNENLQWIKVIPVTYPCEVRVYASGYKPAANPETGGTV